jgi:hypothetical protein
VSSPSTKMSEPNFLGGFDSLLRVNKDPLLPIVEDVATLCIQMCIADAMHDSKIIANVQNLQSQSLRMLNQLQGQIQNITDRSSVEHCLRLCRRVIEEVEVNVLEVETEVMSNTAASPKSTVMKLHEFYFCITWNIVSRVSLNVIQCSPPFKSCRSASCFVE